MAVGEGWGILSGGRIQFAVHHEIALCPSGGGTWQQFHSISLVSSWGRPGRFASSPSNRGDPLTSCCTMAWRKAVDGPVLIVCGLLILQLPDVA